MVSLILVCEALGNGLKGGLLNIVDFTFNKLPQVTHRRIVVKQIFITQFTFSQKSRERLSSTRSGVNLYIGLSLTTTTSTRWRQLLAMCRIIEKKWLDMHHVTFRELLAWTYWSSWVLILVVELTLQMVKQQEEWQGGRSKWRVWGERVSWRLKNSV